MKEKCENKTDEELVKLSLESPDYYACLMGRYEQPLSRYVRRLMPKAGETLDDILQEVFIKTYVNLNAFRPELKFSSWIYRITHNHVVSHFRKTGSRPQIVSLEGSEFGVFAEKTIDESGSTKNALYAKEEVEYILGTMDEDYRSVLVLRFLEGMEYNEISDILKKPIGTVGTLLSRAKTQFKKEYENRYGHAT